MALNILMVSTSFVRGGAGKMAKTISQELGRSKFGFDYYSASDNHMQIYFRMGLSAFLGSDQVLGSDPTKLDIYKHADIIHLHNLHGSYFKLATLPQITKEKKVVWTLHDLWAIHGKSPGVSDDYSRLDYPPMLFNTTKSLLKKKAKIYQKCSNLHLVVPSNWMKKQLKGSILDKFPVTLIPNGIDTNKYVPSDKKNLKKSLNLKGNVALIVASGGVYNQDKGGKEMLELVRAMPLVTFVIIGGKNGPELPNVRYISELNRDRLILYYQAADICISLSYSESFGLSIVEAQSCATPILAYDSGAVSEVIFDQNNLVNSGDFVEMVKKISVFFAKSNKEQAAIGKKARSYVLSNFTLSQMINGYQKLYQAL